MSDINIIEQKEPYDAAANIAVVRSQFNGFVVDKLFDGAIRTLNQYGIDEESITVVKVPGAFEIPVAVKTLLDKGQFDAVITLGTIIRGETPHFEYIANECAHGISQLAINTGVPVIFGVLTVDNVDQALDRAGEEESNKGSEAALTALEMIGVIKKIKS